MPHPADKQLYQTVKAEADKKFLAPTSVYKSAWIVAEYKKRGGVYKEDGKKKGLTQWFKEKWVDLERPQKDRAGKVVGFEPCGRPEASAKGTYPLCRPSKRVNKTTPATVTEVLTPRAKSDIKPLRTVEKEKQKIKHTGYITFHKKK